MARNGSVARLVVALSVAAVLAVFLLYTSIAGGGTPSVSPSELEQGDGVVALTGLVLGPVSGDPHGEGMRFRLKDIEGTSSETVWVLYQGSVPDLFRAGRHVVVDGSLQGDTFVAESGSMVTKCPSKYQAADEPAPA
ncbi:MAG: cytochrome c maturation protein CcmE [Thermoleophilia bacterium]|nr:cytochrome c maturation protein CcmE [Thermoleophilia bacterium]